MAIVGFHACLSRFFFGSIPMSGHHSGPAGGAIATASPAFGFATTSTTKQQDGRSRLSLIETLQLAAWVGCSDGQCPESEPILFVGVASANSLSNAMELDVGTLMVLRSKVLKVPIPI